MKTDLKTYKAAKLIGWIDHLFDDKVKTQDFIYSFKTDNIKSDCFAGIEANPAHQFYGFCYSCG